MDGSPIGLLLAITHGSAVIVLTATPIYLSVSSRTNLLEDNSPTNIVTAHGGGTIDIVESKTNDVIVESKTNQGNT